MIRHPRSSALFPYTTLFRSTTIAASRWTGANTADLGPTATRRSPRRNARSEEHTSELQSRVDIVCRLLLEKKKEGAHKAARPVLARPRLHPCPRPPARTATP